MIRSGSSLLMGLFALIAFLLGSIQTHHLFGIGLSILYLILINPPTLFILRYIKSRKGYRYFSILINFLEIVGYTAIIYFLGGIEATYLTPIYAALVTYVGVASGKRVPFFAAALCATLFAAMVLLEYLGVLPNYTVASYFHLPPVSQLIVVFVVMGLLFVTAYISSYTAGLLKMKSLQLNEQNKELEMGAKQIEAAEKELRRAHSELESRIEERTTQLLDANKELRAEIAERKLAERALEESEEKYRLHFQNVTDVIYSIDTEFKVLSVSPAVIDVLGYRPEELVGRPFMDLNILAPGYEAAAASDLMRVLRGEELAASVYEFIAKDGTKKIGEVSGAPLVRSGQVIGVVSVGRDITARRRLEMQLRHAQKMESIGTITSGVAHNFRNILSGISVNAQLIELKHDLDPQIREISDRITVNVKRGSQLVEELMQFSRKRDEKVFETLNLAGLLHETYRIIRESFDKRIDISMETPEHLPIKGEHGGVSQVLMNLCTNARDAMPDGGQLRIEGKIGEGRALVIISDSGLGMDEDTMNHCFDPFYTTKAGTKGTGLGLSTAYGIVKEHGGDIQIKSDPGQGTVFEMHFPIVAQQTENHKASPSSTVHGKGEKILFVDDEVQVLEPIDELFREMGYAVASTDSGEKAIDKYKSWKPDVVLLDRNMPGMDGISCAREIIAFDPTAKIVLISGYDEDGPYGIDSSAKDLIKGYLVKPIKVSESSRMLRRLLNE